MSVSYTGTWGQPNWGGAVPYAAPRMHPQRPNEYAGFWRRWTGAFLDQMVITLIMLPIQLVLGFGSRAMANAAATCTSRPMGNGYVYRTCETSSGIVLLAAAVSFLINVVVWWRFIVTRQVREGQTIGMAAMDVEVRDASSNMMISTGQAFLRSILGGILAIVFMVPAGLVFLMTVVDADSRAEIYDALSLPVLTLLVFLTLLTWLPWAWNLGDRRRQTLYDKMTGTVVVRTRR